MNLRNVTIFALSFILNFSYSEEILKNGNKAIRGFDRVSGRAYVMDPLNRYVWLLPARNQKPLSWMAANNECKNLNKLPEAPLGLKKWQLPTGHIVGYRGLWYQDNELIFNIAFQKTNSSSYNKDFNYALIEAIPELKGNMWWSSTGGLLNKRVFMKQQYESKMINGKLEINFNKLDSSKEEPAIGDSAANSPHKYVCVSEY